MNTASFFALALLVTPCAIADATAPRSVAETQIRAALAEWVDAANRGDYRAALRVWAPDLIGWAPEGVDDTYAREAEAAKLPLEAPKTTYELTINEVIVDVSLAVVRDTWTATTKRDSGPDATVTFRSYEVWRRQSDMTWKISRWIDGPALPPK